MATQRGRGKPKRYEGEDSARLSVLIRPRYREALEIIARDRQSTISEAMELCIAKLASEYTINDTSLLTQIMPELSFKINFDSYINKGNLDDAIKSLDSLFELLGSLNFNFFKFRDGFLPLGNEPYLKEEFLIFLHENIKLFLESECYKVYSYSASLRTPKELFQASLLGLFQSDIPIDQVNFFWALLGEFYNTGFTLNSATQHIKQRLSLTERKYTDALTWNLSTIIKLSEGLIELDNYLEILEIMCEHHKKRKNHINSQ